MQNSCEMQNATSKIVLEVEGRGQRHAVSMLARALGASLPLLCHTMAMSSQHMLPAMARTRVPAMVLDMAGSRKATNSDASASDECVGNRNVNDVSYREQFDDLFSRPLQTSKPVPKPSNAAQAREKGAIRVPFSNVYGTLMRGVRCAARPVSLSSNRSDYTY